MHTKILIADDHPLISKGIKDTLESNGKNKVVAIVNNGKEAIEYIKNHDTDILLLDIDMTVEN